MRIVEFTLAKSRSSVRTVTRNSNNAASGILNVRRRTHTGGNTEQHSPPILCSQNSGMHEQQRFIHIIEKPFVCHVCDEAFSAESLL